MVGKDRHIAANLTRLIEQFLGREMAITGRERQEPVRIRTFNKSSTQILLRARRRPQFHGVAGIGREHHGGLGIALISTSRGLMTGHNAQRLGLGGEVVAFVW